MTTLQAELIERYLETCDDLKALTKRKKDVTAENVDLKEKIMEMMRVEDMNKIEYGANELTLKKSKRTKSLNVSQVILLMEEHLKSLDTYAAKGDGFVTSFMDDFVASIESEKDVTEADTLHVKRAS